MDQPTTPAPAMPPLMSAGRVHDIGRLYQALAKQFEAGGGNAQAARELRKAQRWLTYSITLTQTGSKEA